MQLLSSHQNYTVVNIKLSSSFRSHKYNLLQNPPMDQPKGCHLYGLLRNLGLPRLRVTKRDSPCPEIRAEGRVSNDGQGRADPGGRRVSQNVQLCVLGTGRDRAHAAHGAHTTCPRYSDAVAGNRGVALPVPFPLRMLNFTVQLAQFLCNRPTTKPGSPLKLKRPQRREEQAAAQPTLEKVAAVTLSGTKE